MKILFICISILFLTLNSQAGVVRKSKHLIVDDQNNIVCGVNLVIEKYDSLGNLERKYIENLCDTCHVFWLVEGRKCTYKVSITKDGYETLNSITPNEYIVLKKKSHETIEIDILFPDISNGFNSIEHEKQVTIKGKVTSTYGIFEVYINNEVVYFDSDGNFTKVVLLESGNNPFTLTAADLKKNKTYKRFSIERK